ncbi:hypothetical protein [Adhaeribacter pallidiroseus]|uniref:Uncharacterized protein n=1 Tax=Adhaeribacter pallidiroseus TaxID=2072847 RepID=A0A369QN63_9BACT|nr:hypothetical protein [Adhaeribacter pallidiroseus]RDC63648.1 hypothetical protein AHMF7616_02253 [Adhaeribacter pallidiroseus]
MLDMTELKNKWNQSHTTLPATETYDPASFQKIMVSRIRKQRYNSMQYFWASLVLQIIVYAMLSHVALKYWSDTVLLGVAIGCALLYVPFTIMLLRKFKQLAVLQLGEKHTAGFSIYEYVHRQHALLSSFYTFKKRYELVLIPLSSAILIWVFFRIYLPGGVMAHPVGAIICMLITLASCAAAIVAENKKRFQQPLTQLQQILNDLEPLHPPENK